MKILPHNGQFASMDDNYLLMNHWYAEWMKVTAPPAGFKIHISVVSHFAEITARSVLPKLIDLSIKHKVVKNKALYEELLGDPNRGKFITIYLKNFIEVQRVVGEIDPELSWMMGSNARGPIPTTRSSKHIEKETPLGISGLLFWRSYSGGD